MYCEKGRFSVEVCLSPYLYPLYEKHDSLVVIIDIFRASTSIVAGIGNGIKSIIPVARISQSEEYKSKGFIVAGERDGKKLDCADFGNSPFNFLQEHLKDKTVAVNTTNGTQAIEAASKHNNLIAIGAFINLEAIVEFCHRQQKELLIFCAGWKNRFSMEDSLFAGALVHELINRYPEQFHTICDSAIACADLWQMARHDLNQYIQKAAHSHRLKKMGLDDVIPYCLSLNLTDAVPVLENGHIVKAI